jgi:hypothetical protein
MAVATLFVVSADVTYNQTSDEAAHIACGMEWLAQGTYNLEALHPPIARVAMALPLYLKEIPYRDIALKKGEDWHLHKWDIGTALLNWNGAYKRNLLLARLGILPFFWFGAALIYFWMKKNFGIAAAVVSLLLFDFCPPILANAAVATTDLPLCVMFLGALMAFEHCLNSWTLRAAAIATVAVALSVLTKFTAIPFLLASIVVMLVLRGLRRPELVAAVRTFAVVTIFSLPIIWAAYRFSYAPILTADTINPTSAAALAKMSPGRVHLVTQVKLPAPEFALGVINAIRSGSGMEERYAYALGKTYSGGRWYFFPVAILAKSPIPLLLLCIVGIFFLARGESLSTPNSRSLLLAGLISPLLVAIPSQINIGLRHVLAIYPFMTMLGAAGAIGLWRSKVATARMNQLACIVLLIWTILTCGLANPEFLPYFNELARPFAAEILVRGDLDWGQDFYRLEDVLRTVPPEDVYYSYWGDPSLIKHDHGQWKAMTANTRPVGWVAISESIIRMDSPGEYAWLKGYPYIMVGRSIRLYHFVSSPADVIGVAAGSSQHK